MCVTHNRSTVILSALQTAIDTRSANLMTIALDCLGKFITYNYLADIEDEATQSQVMERVVDSICDCFIGEETDEKVQLQIVKVTFNAWTKMISRKKEETHLLVFGYHTDFRRYSTLFILPTIQSINLRY